jgi:hypothetical protein
LAIKVIRRLLIAGFEFPNRDNTVNEFWTIIRGQLGELLPLVTDKDSPLSIDVRQMIEKHLAQFAKLHLHMARTHPAAFILLPDSLNIVRAYWDLVVSYGESFGVTSVNVDTNNMDDNDDEDGKNVQEVLSQKGLLIIRACLKMVFNPQQTFRYRHAQEKQEKAQATEIVKTDLLTEAFVRQLMEVTVTRFFVFRPIDIKQWNDEPEEWENGQAGEGEDYEFAIRPCAEKLFLDLAINFKELISQPLLNVFHSISCKTSTNIASSMNIADINSSS